MSGIINSNCIIKIAGVDFYKQIALKTDENLIKNLNLLDLKFLEINNNQFVKNSIIVNESILNYNKYYFEKTSNSYICLNMIQRRNVPINEKFILKIKLDNANSNLTLEIFFRECVRGESLTSNFVCKECDPETYSFNNNLNEILQNCKSCDSKNFYCYGGDKLTPKPGFWRFTEKSTKFYECPKKNLCLGFL